MFNATVVNAEIRGCERKTNQKGEDYILVRLEDETGKAVELVDKSLDRQEQYKRGTVGDVKISIDQGRQFTTIRIVDFTPKDV